MEEQAIAALVGKNISRYRKKVGYTQEQLAECIGVTPAFISRVECGKKSMKISKEGKSETKTVNEEARKKLPSLRYLSCISINLKKNNNCHSL